MQNDAVEPIKITAILDTCPMCKGHLSAVYHGPLTCDDCDTIFPVRVVSKWSKQQATLSAQPTSDLARELKALEQLAKPDKGIHYAAQSPLGRGGPLLRIYGENADAALKVIEGAGRILTALQDSNATQPAIADELAKRLKERRDLPLVCDDDLYRRVTNHVANFCEENERVILTALRSDRNAVVEGWPSIVTAPKDGTEVLLYREDAGVFFGFYGTMEHLRLTEREIDDIDEETYFAESWWAYCQDGLARMEGDEEPTAWCPVPKAESLKDTEQ